MQADKSAHNYKEQMDKSAEIGHSLHNLTIYGVKKNFSKSKLKCLMIRAFGQLDDVLLIPYIDWNILKVTCNNKATYERLLNFDSSFAAFIPTYKIRASASEVEILPPHNSIIVKLNHDCLRHVCTTCSLKTQIQLAKVSQVLLAIISDIWIRRNGNNFSYDLYEYDFKHDLTATELQDFLIISGPFVKKINFNTILNFALIQRYSASFQQQLTDGGNLMQSAKKFINVNFCKNVTHFSNIQALEVHGKFLADFTVRELARCCKNLKVLKLLDVSTRWLSGKNVHLLYNLTELCLKDCENVTPKYMLKICSSLKHLKKLNIIDCIQLQNEKFIVQMCASAKKLDTLKLSAIAHETALDAILKLKQLKTLQFYWLNAYAEFESLYFVKLLQHKRAQLVTLAFSNNRVGVENASKSPLTQCNYALMRENTTINGRVWNLALAATETEIVTTLAQFTALSEIRFVYCRLLTSQTLLSLCSMSKSLKCIKLLGCRQENDQELLHLLQRKRCNAEVTACDICIEGLTPLEVLQRMRQRALRLPYRTERNNEPVMRSILCEFN